MSAEKERLRIKRTVDDDQYKKAKMTNTTSLLVAGLTILFISTPTIADQKTDQGFAITEQLSHEALGHDGNIYPKGKVIESMNVSGYTYFQFLLDGKPTWAATSSMELKKGDQVVLFKSYPMENFTSKSLNKTFAEILFVSHLDIVTSP